MTVVAILGKKSENRTCFMVELLSWTLIEEIKRLIRYRRCEDAISHIMSNGKLIKELSEQEIGEIKSDLIITAQNAYWTVM